MNLFAEGLAWLGQGQHWSGPAGIWARTLQHLVLTLVVMAISILVAVPIGVLVGHTRRGAGVIGAIAGAGRAIPTLGLLTLFGLLGLGIGVQPPLWALVVLAIPSLLAGAYSGVMAIDPTIPSAATAIGMSPWQVITRVEGPLALPAIVGGVRAATLQVLATATLAAYTADLGLGRFLLQGLKDRDYPQMVGAALLVTALAVIAELVLALCQRWARGLARPTGREEEVRR